MLLTEEEIKARVESPMNLMNRLRSTLDRASHSPVLPPKAEDVITDLEDKINQSSTKKTAAKIMNAAMVELEKRMPEVQKPEKLAQIAVEMSKVISNQEAKANNTPQGSQIIVYAPQVQNIDSYNIVEVAE